MHTLTSSMITPARAPGGPVRHRRRNAHALVCGILLTSLAWAPCGIAQWQRILEDDFSTASDWTYQGVQNDAMENLFRVDTNRVIAEWDAAYGLPVDLSVITTSYLARPLGQTLSDAHSFRVRVSVELTSIKTQTANAGYQLANFGLFNPSHMGQNRTYIDTDGDWVADDMSRNLAEFNYFMYGYFGGSNVQPNLFDADRTHVYGSNESALGSHSLPLSQWLHLELVYDADIRAMVARVYEDAAYEQIMSIGGILLEEHSQFALGPDASFTLTHVGFFNYQAVDWDTNEPLTDVGGTGRFANLSVDVIPEPGALAFALIGLAGLAVARARRRAGV
jgi:hypothetical protein